MMKTVCAFKGIESEFKSIQQLGLKATDHLEEHCTAIKIGALQTSSAVSELKDFLLNYTGFVVWNFSLFLLNETIKLSTFIDAVIIRADEVENFLDCSLNSYQEYAEAAQQLLDLGFKGVLLHATKLCQSPWNYYYWTNGVKAFWLSFPQNLYSLSHEQNEILSTALATVLALDYSIEDSLILALMYVRRGIRLGSNTFYHSDFPESEIDIPYVSSFPLYELPKAFQPCPYLGLYPVVDSIEWVEFLLKQGIKAIQLRIKEKTDTLEEIIRYSIALAKSYKATLFINDHWELALKLGADAVHLGQEDLDTADITAICDQGMLLGVSTYCYYEVARALALCPSYIAIGPIYPTESKELSVSAQGVERLKRWQRILSYPLVAIGGINQSRIAEVASTGVYGIALISAITQAEDPQKATQELLENILPKKKI